MNTTIDSSFVASQTVCDKQSLVKQPSGFLALCVASAFSLLITAALLLLMHSLIYQEYVEPVDGTPPVDTNLVMPDTDIPTIKESPKPEKIEEPSEVPDTPNLVPDLEFDPGHLIPTGISHTPIKSTPTGVSVSGMLVKRVAAAPVYPRRALTREIEGFVDLVFDVTAYGSTENIRVLQAEPEGVFENAARKAIAKYKYQPEMSEGEPIATKNVMERIRFTIQQ